MEGYRRREARTEPARKPEKFGGRQNFTRAMLLAALAAFNAPETADAQQMPPGTKRAIERIDERSHRKAARHIESTVPRAEELAENIELIEAKLGPGGEWASLLEDPATPRAKVDAIFRYINKVNTHIDVMQVMPEAFKDQPAAHERIAPRRELFHGSDHRSFKAFDAEGKPYEKVCNGYHVATGGARFFVTAKHCITGTALEGSFAVPDGHANDIAVKYLPGDHGPAMQLDGRTDRDFQGRMAVIRGIDRFGRDFLRTSFLIKMSPALQEKLYGVGDRQVGNFDLRDQFMLLAQPGDATLMHDRMLSASGVSGTGIKAWIDGGYRALGPQSSGRVFTPEQSASIPPDQQIGLNSPMFFVEGLDVLKELCERARQQHEQPKRPPKEASGFMQRIGN